MENDSQRVETVYDLKYALWQQGRKNENQYYLLVIYGATFDVDTKLGHLKKIDNFLNHIANLMVSMDES